MPYGDTCAVSGGPAGTDIVDVHSPEALRPHLSMGLPLSWILFSCGAPFCEALQVEGQDYVKSCSVLALQGLFPGQGVSHDEFEIIKFRLPPQ